MSQTYGISAHGHRDETPHRQPVRFVVVIDAGGSGVAMLFLATRTLVAEIDAGAEEISSMISGIMPTVGAHGPEWDAALQGHNLVERSEARVYALDI
jgi:hypothetical protein